MFENYVIVPRKRTMGNRIGALLLFCVMLAFFLLGTLISPFIFEIPGVACGIGWYLLTFRSYVEYEYSYFEGDLKITKIKNKSRRKKLLELSLDKVVVIAPKGSSSVSHYEEDKQVYYRKYTSGSAEAKAYDLIYSSDEGMERIEFEPDEKMIDAMRTKYSRVVMK